MKNCLKYKNPATCYEKGMPIGNGRLGAMLLGGAEKESISLNEDTLWSGYPKTYNDEKVYEYLQPVREAIFQKQYQKAEKIINEHMVGVWNESYLPMADVDITIEDREGELFQGEITEYERELDMETAICTTSFRLNGNACRRSVFCSYPDQVIVMKFQAEEPVFLEIGLRSQLKGWMEREAESLYYHGWCPEIVEPSYYDCENPIIYKSFEESRAIRFRVGIKVVPQEGTLVVRNDKIIIEDCRECMLLISSANSFISFNKMPQGEYKAVVERYLNEASARSYEEILRRHQQDYQNLFARVVLDLGHTEQEKLSMDERLAKFQKVEDDPELVATVFQFGRYLTIASSRPGSQPANLQGIWNHELRAPWSANYTVNINTEMNYWPTEVCNLSECTEPLLRLIEECAVAGSDTARINYHCQGWCVHHNVDLWRKTTAVGARNKDTHVLPWSFWLAGGGWLCRHLWEHAQYTKEKNFLEETVFPIMLSAAAFYLDWMLEKDGQLVTCPSTTPENMFHDEGVTTGISYASAMDMEVIKELFVHCMESSKEISLTTEQAALLERIKQAVPKLPHWQIGKYGQLQEWAEDFTEHEVTHRHVSMLYGLYPSDLFGKEKDAALEKACKMALDRRGDDGVAWSRAWKISLFARLKEGEAAGSEVEKYLQYADLPDAMEISYTTGGIYDNLFAARPMQIDGCLGFSAGIAEMLLQDYTGEEQILPAIPKSWKQGYVKGLKLRNGKQVDICWGNEEVHSFQYEGAGK